MSNNYDIQHNSRALAEVFRNKFPVIRHVGNFLEVSVACVRVDLDYMGEGIWGVDPVFTSNMVCYGLNRDAYARFMLLLSDFNVKSNKRYLKATT